MPGIPKNQSGYGRGQYASPEQVEAYRRAIGDWFARVNAEFIDSFSTRENPNPEVGDIMSPFRLSGHLLKWAIAEKLLDPSLSEEKLKATERGNYLAIVYHRSKADRIALTKEASRYVAEAAEKRRKDIEILRTEGGHDD